MRSLQKHIILLLFGVSSLSVLCRPPTVDDVLHELAAETMHIHSVYDSIDRKLRQAMYSVNVKMNNASTVEQKVELLFQKDKLEGKIRENEQSRATELSKIRYIKGLQIINILYEKTLALDHHFASVSTFRDLNNLSNPNHYAEFISVKQNLLQQKRKKEGFNLSELLGNNVYTSVIHSFVSLFTSEGSSRIQKEQQLQQVECILDFTLMMHQDLNTIYFETIFLQKSNEAIMEELQQLFFDYTKPVQYKKSLAECRNTDDWGTIRNYLQEYLESLQSLQEDPENQRKAHRMQVNLHFPIDRLLQFITKYNAFIDQGEKFYEKFAIMLNSYENEALCSQQIPAEFQQLKQGIQIAIEKFNTAYKPVEINGSKMKEILYGINEYE
ncbi:hypothetical protein [Luteirhabdus pelagi]|uniref:hypothetical protein n=1 Tax=Luteirhabdus pelagi TaxID=2792783 RepID=UPI00193A7C94|nr:hypothetical protein [Luteirhabdus pelagi]